MVANRGDHLLLVVNAARKAADLEHLRAGLGRACGVEPLDRALVALQGPKAEAALATLLPDVAAMRFMDVRALDAGGTHAVVSRSGYTGEDGFEISLDPEKAQDFAERLLRLDGVLPVGLGARDSLRLEAGLCLGHDIDETTTPVEAALEWAIQPARRRGGARAGGFPGDAVILGQIAAGATRRRVGLRPEGRAPMREPTALFAAEDGAAIGAITSAASGRASTRRWPWATCRSSWPRRARGSRPVAREDAACDSHENALHHPGLQTLSDGETNAAITEEHEWLKQDGDEVIVGITEYAAEQLGDLVFVELPAEGRTVAKGEEIVTIQIGQGRQRHRRAARRPDHRGEPRDRRQPGARQRGPDGGRLVLQDDARGPVRARGRAHGRGGLQATGRRHRAEATSERARAKATS